MEVLTSSDTPTTCSPLSLADGLSPARDPARAAIISPVVSVCTAYIPLLGEHETIYSRRRAAAQALW
jgi:hypothetical protein